MDDLLVFVEDPDFDTSVLATMYPSPLELEVENHDGVFRFLETWNHLLPDGSISLQHYHKNFHRLLSGKNPILNIVDHDSHIPRHYKTNRVVGTLHRVLANTCTWSAWLTSVLIALGEFQKHLTHKKILCEAWDMFRFSYKYYARSLMATSHSNPWEFPIA